MNLCFNFIFQSIFTCQGFLICFASHKEAAERIQNPRLGKMSSIMRYLLARIFLVFFFLITFNIIYINLHVCCHLSSIYITFRLRIVKGKGGGSPFKAFLKCEGIITLCISSSDDGCETCGACAEGHETRELNSTKCELCLRGNSLITKEALKLLQGWFINFNRVQFVKYI